MADDNFFADVAGDHDPEVWQITLRPFGILRKLMPFMLAIEVGTVFAARAFAGENFPEWVLYVVFAALVPEVAVLWWLSGLTSVARIDRRAGTAFLRAPFPPGNPGTTIQIEDIEAIGIDHDSHPQAGDTYAMQLNLKQGATHSLATFKRFKTRETAVAAAEPLAEFLAIAVVDPRADTLS